MKITYQYFRHFILFISLRVTRADEDPLCSKIRSGPPGSLPIPIRIEIEEGETFEAKCRFCDNSRTGPVNWYIRPRISRFNKKKQLIEMDSEESEITADPFTFDEFNRVYIGTDNALKIRKFNESDIGAYYCKRFPSGIHSGFEYRAELLLRKEPLIVPKDQKFEYRGPGSLNLTRKMNFRRPPFSLTFNHLHVNFSPGSWGECSACGDERGEQERISECRVKFSYPRGNPMDNWVTCLAEMRDSDMKMYLDSISHPYDGLMDDWDETMSTPAIDRACRENSRGDSLDVCMQKLKDADPGYSVGMGCRNLLQLNRWRNFGNVDGLIFPPPELLGGLVESRTCTSNCSTESGRGGKISMKAKKLLKKKGLNIKKILEKQKKRIKVRPPKRHIIKEYEGTGVKLSCPGAKMDHLLLWKNATLDINPFLVATESHGRISYVNHLVLHIKNLTRSDSQVYSCWQNNALLGEVEIKVVKPKEPPPDIRVALLYLAVGLMCDVLVFVGLMVVRHRQRLAVRMKGYTELHEVNPQGL